MFNSVETKTKVTVLMPVYNASPFLKDAIDSILNQTYQHFEFLIINDGSTDNSAEIIDAFDDVRIKHIKLETNGGIVNALNKGLELARGEYIARMDADDISRPQRLDEQVAFMDANQEIGALGTFVETIDGKALNKQMSTSLLQAALLLNNVFVHSSVMLRKSVLKKYELKYDDTLKHVEDYLLWTKISQYSNLALLPTVLVEYRITETQISSRHKTLQAQNTNIVRQSLFSKILQRPLSEVEIAIVSKGNSPVSFQFTSLVLFLSELVRSNAWYGTSELKFVLRKLLFRNIYNVKFSISDGYHILACEFLNFSQKINTLKYFFIKFLE